MSVDDSQVLSDTAGGVHLHGYDVSAPVAADARAALMFTAAVLGVFEVELGDQGVQLLSLQVR